MKAAENRPLSQPKIWWYQKKVVSLHCILEKARDFSLHHHSEDKAPIGRKMETINNLQLIINKLNTKKLWDKELVSIVK